ncbi:hypothetical protein [Brevibacillus sp. SKDU10]|uniref:hypothetical protein n=1 Tax=Brevibacillus sp. SKDU10 TaxID=1247872 RepID=UPI000AC0785A|nr:hypothetical protein [Brevibacillus sp. SKDU10]
MLTFGQIIFIVIAVGYVSISIGVTIKLYNVGLRGLLLLCGTFLPFAFAIMCVAITNSIANELKIKPRHKVSFFIAAFKHAPWLLPTSTAMVGKVLMKVKSKRKSDQLGNVTSSYKEILFKELLHMKLS